MLIFFENNYLLTIFKNLSTVECYDVNAITDTSSNRMTIGSLRYHHTIDSDAGKTSIKKMNLYFTLESRDTLKSFIFVITVKAVTKLKLRHSDKFELKM